MAPDGRPEARSSASSVASHPSPLSVVHLCAPAHVGGLERVVQGLSRGLVLRGHRVDVVAVLEPGVEARAFLDPIARAGAHVHTLVLPGRAYLTERRQVSRLLHDLKPDVLHTHGYRPDLLHGGWARRKGIATVSTLHGSSRMGGISHLYEWIQERALARFDAVVAVSAPLVDALARQGVPRERIHHVPNAWSPPETPHPRGEARRLLGLPDSDTRVLGWIGRLIPIKGADVFVRSLAEVGEGDWCACVVGDGPERPALDALVRELGLEQKVRRVGAVDDAGRMLAAFDVFVLSSRSEGTPIVLLEAMGAGRPIVATTVGGVPAVLAEGREAWLVPSEAPGAMADAIRDALARPEEAARRGARARARVEEEFNPEVWILRHEQLYRDAIANRRRTGRR